MNIALPPEMVARITAALNKAGNEVASEIGMLVAQIVSVTVLDKVLRLLEKEKFEEVPLADGHSYDAIDYDSVKTKLEEWLKDPISHLGEQDVATEEEL